MNTTNVKHTNDFFLEALVALGTCVVETQCVTTSCKREQWNLDWMVWVVYFPIHFEKWPSFKIHSGLYNLCKLTPMWLVKCNTQIYYVLIKNKSMTHAYILIGDHKHLVGQGVYRKTARFAKRLIENVVKHSLNRKKIDSLVGC
jgi:hypothetical protein